ncbi:MAG: hypothetical protein GY849_02290 [Deltaproteobacteria bacterium]|nr:hypothetical protein [Deltaproteobacteria bacterium]
MNIICLADGDFHNITDEIKVLEVIFFEGFNNDIFKIMHHYNSDENKNFISEMNCTHRKLEHIRGISTKEMDMSSVYFKSIWNILKNCNLHDNIKIHIRTSEEKKPLKEFIKTISVI